MDLPNEHILDALFPQIYDQAIEDDEEHRDLVVDRNATQDFELMRQMQVDQSLLGAGDGLHNDTNNLPPIIFVQRQPMKSSKLWYYMPMLLLMGSSWLLKTLFRYFGINIKSTKLLGMSCNTYFNILERAIILATFWYKAKNK